MPSFPDPVVVGRVLSSVCGPSPLKVDPDFAGFSEGLLELLGKKFGTSRGPSAHKKQLQNDLVFFTYKS